MTRGLGLASKALLLTGMGLACACGHPQTAPPQSGRILRTERPGPPPVARPEAPERWARKAGAAGIAREERHPTPGELRTSGRTLALCLLLGLALLGVVIGLVVGALAGGRRWALGGSLLLGACGAALGAYLYPRILSLF